jgi:hypothetical protein
MRTVIAVVALLALAVPCSAQTITLDSVTNCWDFVDGQTLSLAAGAHYIEWVSGALSPFPDDTYQGGYVWQSTIDVYVYSTAQYGTIGAPSPGWHTSFSLAETAARGIYVLVLPSNSVVAFYFPEISYDIERCLDNRGSVTLRFVQPLKTETSTWGKIKALYRR